MRTNAVELTGEFQVTGWDEKPYHEAGDEKLTHASVTQKFSGAIEGDGSVGLALSGRSD